MTRVLRTSNSKQEIKQVAATFMGFDPELTLVRLPVKKKRFTVIRSPHVTNRSREQFELRTRKWLLKTNMPFKAVKNFIKTERVSQEFPGVLIRLKKIKTNYTPIRL